MDLAQQADLIPPKLPFGVIGSLDFDPAGKRLAFSMQTPSAPVRRLGVDARATASSSAGRRARSGRSTRRRFVAPTLVHYPTFDKVDGKPREIPAWVYKPAGAGPHPGADQHPRRAGGPGAADVQHSTSSSGPSSSATR